VSNPSGTVTLTPTQTLSSTAFDILFKPVPGFSISAADFYIRGGNAGSTADASSGTVFTHGTNGITLNSTAGDRPLTSVTFHNTVAANDPANNVRATLLLGNTGTLSADLDYFLDIANDVIALPDPARYRLTTVLTLYDTSGADLPSFTSYTNGSNMEGGAIFDTGVTTSSLTKQRQIHFVGLGISHSTPTLMGTIRLTAPSGRKFSNDIINNGFDIAAISNQLEPLTEDVTQYHFTQVMSSSDTIIDINIFYRNQGQPSLPGSSSGVVGISKKSVGGSLTQST
jgi:hypothetical protein